MKLFKEFSIISLIYLSIIISTSYHTATTPPDDTFEPGAFHVATSAEYKGNPIFAKYFKDFAIIFKKFNNMGWQENFHPRIMTGMNDLWKSSGTWEDNGYYLIYAGYHAGLIKNLDYDLENFNQTHSVFKYRWMIPYCVGKIYKTINYFKAHRNEVDYQWNEKSISRIVYIWLSINLISILLTSLLLFYYLKNVFKFSTVISFIGGIFFITSLIVLRTSNFPMSEPMACLITILLFILLFYKKYFSFILISLIGIASRDVFLFSSVLLFFNIDFKKKKSFLIGVCLSFIPVIFYIAQRFYINREVSFEITMGRDLLKDQFIMQGLIIFKDIDNFLYFIFKLSLTFGIFWVGIFYLKKNQFLLRSFASIIFLIAINLLFVGNGSGITRHVGLMFPIMIPLFLYFLKEQLIDKSQ